MPRYYFHVTTETTTDVPPLETLPIVAADSPSDAIARLEDQGRLPIAGDGLYLRLVGNDAEFVVPLSPEFELPLDWHPEQID